MSAAPKKASSKVKKTSKTVTTPPKKVVKRAPPARARRLKQAEYRSFRLHRKIKPLQPELASSFKLFKRSLKQLKDNWRLFTGIVIIYALLNMILVRGFTAGSLDLSSLKHAFQLGVKGPFSNVTISAALFTQLLGTTNQTGASATGSAYQGILLVIVSLATIWGLRQVLSGERVRIRDTFYKGLYPLIPFTLVLLVIGVELLPLVAGSWVYTVAVGSGILTTVLEKILFIILFILLAILTFYMLCSSLFGLYIVCLPDMTPIRALRSARKLVLHRRWTVIRKLLFLPVAILVLAALIMLPILLLLTAIAVWVYFILSLVAWVLAIAYMYNLYRELLNE